MTCRRLLALDCMHPAHRGPTTPEGCARCPDYAGPPRGAGDVVATVASAVGIRPRDGCRCLERRAALNRAVPFADLTRQD